MKSPILQAAIEAIEYEGCQCDDELDGIEPAERRADQHQLECVAGRCGGALQELEGEKRVLTDEVADLRAFISASRALLDQAIDLTCRAAVRTAPPPRGPV